MATKKGSFNFQGRGVQGKMKEIHIDIDDLIALFIAQSYQYIHEQYFTC